MLALSDLTRPELLHLTALFMGDDEGHDPARALAGVNLAAGLALGSQVAAELCRRHIEQDDEDDFPSLPLADPDAPFDEGTLELRAALTWLDRRASAFAGSSRLLGLARVLGQAAGLVRVELARREAHGAAFASALGAVVE